MGNGKLIIHIRDAMQASLLEDLLFEVKSGEHVIDIIGWTKNQGEQAIFTINFKHPQKSVRVEKEKETTI